MILIPILALVIGIVLGFLIQFQAGPISAFLGVAVIAGLDSILGGSRSAMEGKFHTDVFVTGFVSNIAIAIFMVWLGERIGISMFLVVAIVLGSRIFSNLSIMRRMALTRWHDRAKRRQSDADITAQVNL